MHVFKVFAHGGNQVVVYACGYIVLVKRFVKAVFISSRFGVKIVFFDRTRIDRRNGVDKTVLSLVQRIESVFSDASVAALQEHGIFALSKLHAFSLFVFDFGQRKVNVIDFAENIFEHA